MNYLLDFLTSEEGPTAVEYAVMLALILAVCLTAIGVMGESTNSSFNNSRDKISSAMNAGK